MNIPENNLEDPMTRTCNLLPNNLLSSKQLMLCMSFFLWFIPIALFVHYQVQPFLEKVNVIVPSEMLKAITGYSRFDVLHATVPSFIFCLFIYFVTLNVKSKFTGLNTALRLSRTNPEKTIASMNLITRVNKYFLYSHVLIFLGFLLVIQQFFWVLSKA